MTARFSACLAAQHALGSEVPQPSQRQATVNSDAVLRKLTVSTECNADAHLLPSVISSMARRGSAAMRAFFLLGPNFRAGRVVRPAFVALLTVSTLAHAGGLDEVAADVDPCPAVAIQNDGSMTAEVFAQWIAVRSMSCGDVAVEPRAFFDRATGERLTDDELRARIFNGSRIDAPAVVPLPGAVWLMLAGLGALAAVRRRRRKTIGDAVVCPEQRDAMEGDARSVHCGSCGVCWSTEAPVAFVEH